MLLAVDAGNTSITLGVFRGERLVARGRIPTGRPPSEARYASALRRFLRGRGNIDAAVISSVVPRATAALKKALRGLVRTAPVVVGRTVKAPVINRYRVPGQVGQDRLVNAAAACFLYGGPAIVVDFGTAVTLDLVSRRREYLGGLIVPGLEISLEALYARTALLPKVKLAPPREFLGRDTRTSMLSGLFNGYGALCDGLVARLKQRYAPRAKVIATGGHAPMIAPFCRSVQIVNSDLTLQGLRFIYQKSY